MLIKGFSRVLALMAQRKRIIFLLKFFRGVSLQSRVVTRTWLNDLDREQVSMKKFLTCFWYLWGEKIESVPEKKKKLCNVVSIRESSEVVGPTPTSGPMHFRICPSISIGRSSHQRTLQGNVNGLLLTSILLNFHLAITAARSLRFPSLMCPCLFVYDQRWTIIKLRRAASTNIWRDVSPNIQNFNWKIITRHSPYFAIHVYVNDVMKRAIPSL